jgi:hypothetical protein
MALFQVSILAERKEKDVVCVPLHEFTDRNPVDQAHLSPLLLAV